MIITPLQVKQKGVNSTPSEAITVTSGQKVKQIKVQIVEKNAYFNKYSTCVHMQGEHSFS